MLVENLALKTGKHFLKSVMIFARICCWLDLSPKYSSTFNFYVSTQYLAICFRDIQEVSSEFALNLSSDQNSAKNNTENSTVTDAFSTIATISRIVCGRNLSASTFSSGGAATRYTIFNIYCK